jgi:hypothetical protein
MLNAKRHFIATAETMTEWLIEIRNGIWVGYSEIFTGSSDQALARARLIARTPDDTLRVVARWRRLH